MSAPNLMRKLLDYILEQAKTVDPRVFRLVAHLDGLQKNRREMLGLPGVDFDVKEDGDHVWLRIARLEANRPPAVSSVPILENATGAPPLVVSSDPNGPMPVLDMVRFEGLLARTTFNSEEQRLRIRAMADAKVAQVLEQYVPLWTAWAEAEKPRRKTISLYSDFFALKHALDTEQTANPQELIWGLGVSAWQLQLQERQNIVGIEFQYPLITQTMEIGLDESTLALELRPRAVGPQFCFDAFAACQLPNSAEVEKAARAALAASLGRPVNPFDPGSYEHLLKLIAGNLDNKGRYESDAQAFPRPGEDLVVSDAWVLLSRAKSTNFLLEDIERLKTRLVPDVSIPAGPLALVTAPLDEAVKAVRTLFRGLSGITGSGGSAGGSHTGVQELYFPLPYNNEQVTIVEQLERSAGVAVQGPPGTGKTHTIANIICHYLATGRKVLVTAKGEQALEVLQSKIPKSVRPLTVALLSGDREGQRQFQSAIERIISEVSQLNPHVVEDEIRIARSGIDRAHEQLTSIDRRVDDIAMAQLARLVVDGVEMRAQEMAELVISGEEKHAWFDDVLSLAPEHAPPINTVLAAQAREARRRLGKDLRYTQLRIPSSANMLPSEEIAALHETLVALRTIDAEEARGGLLALRAVTPEVLALAHDLLNKVVKAKDIARELEETGEVWTLELRKKLGHATFASERTAFEALFGDIDKLVVARRALLQTPVEAPAMALTSVKVREAAKRGAATGKPFGALSFGGGDVKELLAAIRVSGLAPATFQDWQHVDRYLALQEQVLSFEVRWNQVADLLSLPSLRGGAVELRKVELVTTNARKAYELAKTYDATLPGLAERVFSKPPLTHLKGTSFHLTEVQEHLRSHLTRVDLTKAATQLVIFQEKLAGTTGPAADELRAFVEKELGNGRVPVERATGRYAELVAELRRIEALAPDLALVNDVANWIEKAGASMLAVRVRSQVADASGEDGVLPVDWRDAWNWSRLRAHLDAIESRAELRSLASRRRDLEAGLARLYEDVVSKSAWLSTKLGASPRVLSALESYRSAVRKIGQGTGPAAIYNRRDAQKAMLDAQGAIPCWVMSHSKVSETLPADLGSFDLVIIDEASQSDIWALPAVLRGKKILVVGDDKQVSPDGGFVLTEHIQSLRQRFLSEQPYEAILSGNRSLYDIASTVYAAQKVMLREHFRCVAPIIGYSARYYSDLQPLRVAKASERIDPPLVDIFIDGGTRDKKDRNRLEAECIVEEIEAVIANPALNGRTLGVVSLLGSEQAKHINTVVRQRVSAKELLQREFEVGDARLFQGSERDIMFISMVVDPADCKALSGVAFEQRFNVAASRARDRMYLVRSVQMKDLSDKDLRRGLLDHFSKPESGPVRDVGVRSLIGLCESKFEEDVFSSLVERGYRVVPQVKAGAFAIDMVVEGMNDARLAIECDGDAFHGPEHWQADMSRQRVLERAGWTFWRCFASTWALRKDEVLEELVERLTAMGIDPLGAIERIPSLVEYRAWAPAKPEDDGNDRPEMAVEEAIAASKVAPAQIIHEPFPAEINIAPVQRLVIPGFLDRSAVGTSEQKA